MRFSVLVPVYNRESYIRQAIESVLSQTIGDDELIVVDDGSSDETPDICDRLDQEIKVIRQDNMGPPAARATGAARAEGEYLAFLDSDDLFMPNALETYDRIIKAYRSPPVILGAMTYFSQSQPVPAFAARGA